MIFPLGKMLEEQQTFFEYRYLLGTEVRTAGDASLNKQVLFPLHPHSNSDTVESPGGGKHTH